MRVGGAYHPQPLPPYLRKRDRRRLPRHAPRAAQPACDRARAPDRDGDDPSGRPAAVHAVVRRTRARRLLPQRARSTTSTPTSAGRRARLHQRPRRDDASPALPRQPGKLQVGVLLPVAGTWRLFLQFLADGRIRDRAVYASSVSMRRLALAAGSSRCSCSRRAGSATRSPRRARSRSRLEASAGGPRLVVVTLVSLGLAAGVSAFAVWLAALGVRERARLRPERVAPTHPPAPARPPLRRSVRHELVRVRAVRVVPALARGDRLPRALLPRRAGAPQRDPGPRRACPRGGRARRGRRARARLDTRGRPRAPAAAARRPAALGNTRLPRPRAPAPDALRSPARAGRRSPRSRFFPLRERRFE